MVRIGGEAPKCGVIARPFPVRTLFGQTPEESAQSRRIVSSWLKISASELDGPWNLNRFFKAQEAVIDRALLELRSCQSSVAGRRRSLRSREAASLSELIYLKEWHPPGWP